VYIDEIDLNMDDKGKFEAKIILKLRNLFIDIKNNHLIIIDHCSYLDLFYRIIIILVI